MGIYMSAIRTGPWFIDLDGKSVFTWKSIDFLGTILLSDGRKFNESEFLGEGELAGRIFSSHPEQNPNIGKDSDGVYFWVHNNESFKAGGE